MASYHESICRCHKVGATLTKLPDFVPFDICLVPESQFWFFSTKISIKICCPLAAKLRNLKLFKMAFQVMFNGKNVKRFGFGLLIAKKMKKQGEP